MSVARARVSYSFKTREVFKRQDEWIQINNFCDTLMGSGMPQYDVRIRNLF